MLGFQIETDLQFEGLWESTPQFRCDNMELKLLRPLSAEGIKTMDADGHKPKALPVCGLEQYPAAWTPVLYVWPFRMAKSSTPSTRLAVEVASGQACY